MIRPAHFSRPLGVVACVATAGIATAFAAPRGDEPREDLWVLSRTPSLPEADRSAIRSALSRHGFDLDRVEWHPHPGGR